jgi:membrane-bound metal-dependent hydrolase YbcI (DUF457 family)
LSSPISHVGLAAVAWPLMRNPTIDRLSRPRKLLLLGAVAFALMAPDLDALPAFLGFGSLNHYHNGPVHSLTFALLFAPLFALGTRWIVPLAWSRLMLIGFLCYSAHLLTDAITHGRGVMLLWPLTDQRFGIPILYGVRHSEPRELLQTLPITAVTDLAFVLVVYGLFRAFVPLTIACSTLPRPLREREGGSPAGGRRWLIDAHVHLHDCFDLARTFDAAVRRFARAGQWVDAEGATSGVLMLTESAGADVFSDLKAGRRPLPAGWASEPCDDPAALRLVRHDGARLLVIAGRQIVTAERLEVLALACADAMDDGRPIDTVLAWCRERDAVALLPWGFGKWTGRRGAIVAGLIEQAESGDLLLGDNAGRLNVSRTPALLRRGAARGLAVLPGSDPLPFCTQQTRAGRYGFALDAALDPQRPAQSLRGHLRALRGRQPVFGRLETLAAFLWYQSAMQWRKRAGKAAAQPTSAKATQGKTAQGTAARGKAG